MSQRTGSLLPGTEAESESHAVRFLPIWAFDQHERRSHLGRSNSMQIFLGRLEKPACGRPGPRPPGKTLPFLPFGRHNGRANRGKLRQNVFRDFEAAFIASHAEEPILACARIGPSGLCSGFELLAHARRSRRESIPRSQNPNIPP
jgi:hypothetical protein